MPAGRVYAQNVAVIACATISSRVTEPVRIGPASAAHFGAEHFVTEYVMTGTAEGKSFAIAGADVFTMRDGLVGRKDSYLDWLAYQRQVGIDPLATFKALGG